MKTNKLLKSNMSVALSLTISSITAQAWPTNSNIAKADFGDTAASEQTKAELNEVINKIFNDQSITNRYLGTTFFHKTSNFPYYHVTFENHQVPDDVIDSTPWYNMWSEAAAAKTKLAANSYTEKTAKNAINTLKYYIQLYNFDVNHDLHDDGFYTTKDFKTPTMVSVSSDGQQDFYKKVTDNKEEIKNLFKESLVGIYKQGQDIEINLVANPDKVSKITSFTVNKVSGVDTNVKLGPSAEDQRIIAFSVPGELKAEQLVISNMTYLDKNGNKQQTGPFALDINYSSAKKNNEAIPKYREKLNEKIQNWIDRGNKVNEWLLTKENTSDSASDFSQRAKITEAVTKLQELKRSENANYDKLYEISTPIHEMEDIATLREVLDIKVAKLLEYFELYNEKTYTKESIEQYKNYIKSVPALKNTKNIKELVQLIKDFDNANFTYLRYNTTELKRIIDIAERKIKSEYEPVTLEKFEQALNHAKDWIKQTESYNPQINDTSDRVKQLTDAINNLVKKDGQKGDPVPAAPVENTTKPVAPYNVTAKFVDRGAKTPIKTRYNRDLSELITNVEVHELGNGKNEVILSLEPKIMGGSVDFALADTFKYNSLGKTDTDAIVLEKKNIGGRDYPTKLKLIVDSTKENIEIALLGNFNFKDSYSLGKDGIDNFTKATDLYIDYYSKVEAKKESPLKAALRSKIDYYTSDAVQNNYKDLKQEFKTSFNQLVIQAQNLLSNESLTQQQVDNMINKLLDESTKLDSLANLHKSLQGAKDSYENEWKNNAHYTSESKTLVKEKLDAVEGKINALTPSDIEGKKQTYVNEFEKEGTVTVYEKLDELTGEIQHLSDYLRINTDELAGEIKKAEEAYNNFNKVTQAKLKLKQLIDEAKSYVANAKLTPESPDTDDQVNTDLTDYYKEQFKFAIADLNGSQATTETVSAKEQLKNKIAEVELINQGKKDPAAFVTLTNELAKAKELLKNDSTSEEALLAELNKLTNAVNTFNNSADTTQEKPNNPTDSTPSSDSNNKIELQGSLLKADSTSPSMANGIIKNTYLVTENGKTYLELDLVPMNNGTANIGVMSKLTYFDGEIEKDVQVLKEDTASVTYNNQTNSYKYPSKIRIPIEGKPTTIKLNTFASSTLFGTDKHENVAILSLKYPKETAAITADKKQLSALFDATTSKYYDSWNNVFKNANVSQDLEVIKNFGNKINAAQNVLKNTTASSEEISAAFTNLLDLKNQYDLLIQLRQSNAEAVANFNSDKESKKYSEASINAVDNFLQEKIDKLEDLIHNNPKSNEILKLFNDVQTYSTMLRYDTSKLEEAVKSAQDKIATNKYSEESKSNLTAVITKATEFINKAKETRNLEDTRADILKEIESAVSGLKEITPAEENKPNDKVDNPVNNEGNKPNDKVDNPVNNEGNKPNESEADQTAKKLATEKANLLLPLETAKILVNDDKDKTEINKEEYTKLKEATEKAQKVYDEEKSIEKIKEEKSNLDKALEQYTKHKTDKENNSNSGNNNSTAEKPGDNTNSGNNNSTSEKPGDNTNSGNNNSTAEKPGDNTNSGNNNSTSEKPGDNTNTGNNNSTNPNTEVKPDTKPDNNPNPSDNIINNIFSNDASGVKVTLTDKTNTAKLSVTPVEDKALTTTVLEKLNLPADNQIRILDLKLLDKNNTVVNSNSKRTVAIVLKEGEKDVAIYHIKDNGDLELIESTTKDGVVTFEINHFSKFAIVSNANKPSNSTSKNSTSNHDNPAGNTLTQSKQQSEVTQPNTSASLNKLLPKTGLTNSNLASLVTLSLLVSGVAIFARRKNRR